MNSNSEMPSNTRIPEGFLPWIALVAGSILVVFLVDHVPWLSEYPKQWVVPLDNVITAISKWCVANLKWFFRAISWLIDIPMTGVHAVLTWLPWPVTISFFVLFALRFGNWKLAWFTFAALGYMVVVGYWEESMNTLSLVAISVPLSVATGLVLGVLAFRSKTFDRVVQPILDIMQTVPAFAYLVPILFLFGFGPVVGVIASIIFAAPPMVRNTILGLERVPPDIIESGVMSGCTQRQQFWQVELPTAMPQILVGVNQTTMAALSMVIIAAIIGGFDDIGWEVLSTMRKAQFGESLLAGLVIALLAMVLDRLSAAVAERRPSEYDPDKSLRQKNRYLILALACLIGFQVLGQTILPSLAVYPESWVIYPANLLNSFLSGFILAFGDAMDAFKNWSLFFIMFPIRNGLMNAINPFTWGFELTPAMIWGYSLVMLALCAWSFFKGRWRVAVSIATAAFLLFYGAAGTPWPIFIALITLLAYQTGGASVAIFALCSLVFMLVNGVWEQVMLSVYLCGVAVLISGVIGGLIGIWAAQNDNVSRIIRPINDTLQTMPPFVLLIPVLMLFKVGEFTALLAVISYAIVPPIRYFEHGLRNVPKDIVEAAQQIGCTPKQILFEVKLPLALPIIMLGLNQTIMYGLAMLVIAALVGTQGLGQQIYLALTQADVGRGMVTGISMALLAMVADRILQAYSRKKQASIA